MVNCRVLMKWCKQGVLVSFIGRIRANTAGFTDERVRLAGEAIAGSLAVKMLGACVGWLNTCGKGRQKASSA